MTRIHSHPPPQTKGPYSSQGLKATLVNHVKACMQTHPDKKQECLELAREHGVAENLERSLARMNAGTSSAARSENAEGEGGRVLR
jgi:hypothetical protein